MKKVIFIIFTAVIFSSPKPAPRPLVIDGTVIDSFDDAEAWLSKSPIDETYPTSLHELQSM